MLTHISSQTLQGVVCLISVSLRQKKYEGALRYLMKNKAADLSRIDLN